MTDTARYVNAQYLTRDYCASYYSKETMKTCGIKLYYDWLKLINGNRVNVESFRPQGAKRRYRIVIITTAGTVLTWGEKLFATLHDARHTYKQLIRSKGGD